MSQPRQPDRLPQEWIEGLSEGDQEVATEIFQRHLELLKRLVQKRLPPGVRRLADLGVPTPTPVWNYLNYPLL